MSDLQYTWKVVAADTTTRTMEVEYTHAGKLRKLNIPLPADMSQVETVVDQYAPINDWLDEAAAQTPVDVDALLSMSGTTSMEGFIEAQTTAEAHASVGPSSEGQVQPYMQSPEVSI